MQVKGDRSDDDDDGSGMVIVWVVVMAVLWGAVAVAWLTGTRV